MALIRSTCLTGACALAAGAGGLAVAQTSAPPPVPESESVGLGTKRLGANRCSVAGNVSFVTARPFRYRGRIALESRRRGSKRWLPLKARTLRKRGKPDRRGRGKGRAAVTLSLRGKVGERIERGDSFRATTVQRVQLDGGLLERTEVRHRLRLKECEFGLGSRFVARSLTAALSPPAGGTARGTATISTSDGRPSLAVRARVPPVPDGEAYEVWLYDDRMNARSLGAQVPDSRGRLRGAGPLPKGYREYASVDISREKIDRNRTHSGRSILRGPLPVDR